VVTLSRLHKHTFSRCFLYTLPRWSAPYCSDPRLSGVQPVAQLTNKTTDTHGYIAVDHSKATVYVVFRGTKPHRAPSATATWLKRLRALPRALASPVQMQLILSTRSTACCSSREVRLFSFNRTCLLAHFFFHTCLSVLTNTHDRRHLRPPKLDHGS
jgi:hypothetical protein